MLKRLLKGKRFQLMTYVQDFHQLSRDTNFGGYPVYNQDQVFHWPVCSSCQGNMQYLGKIFDGSYLNLIFMCQNDPGCCDEWDPDEGGNQIIRFIPETLVAIPAPATGETLRGTAYGCKMVEYKDLTYDDARSNWANKSNKTPRAVLGQLQGKPQWIQGDETPVCRACATPMAFLAQLETGPEYATEMNFGGGGCAYLFHCETCMSAKFLWQC